MPERARSNTGTTYPRPFSMALPTAPAFRRKAGKSKFAKDCVVGPGGVPTFSNFNDLVCPTGAKAAFESKRHFLKLSSLAPVTVLASCWADAIPDNRKTPQPANKRLRGEKYECFAHAAYIQPSRPASRL